MKTIPLLFVFSKLRKMCQSYAEASPESCAKFYSIWSIIVGFGFFIWNLTMVGFYGLNLWGGLENKNDKTPLPIIISLHAFYAFTAFLYVVAGYSMLIGILEVKQKLLKFGKIISWIFPISAALLIIPLVVHILCILKVREYLQKI
ncbi:uncharacterized protein Dana_GF28149 [Drosophila ananassae]|uniref:Uncharacterized protein n=1 Tax=Drosophila ananassae TaxID=7217 RepID=A0A0P8XUW2_DROAN|nr:uncharacterized protein Dana_GF28149 [Drosophila ananassae]